MERGPTINDKMSRGNGKERKVVGSKLMCPQEYKGG